MDIKTYYVGTRYVGLEREVRVVVKGCIEEARGLDLIRAVKAESQDEAARKYVEQITGGTAQVKPPN